MSRSVGTGKTLFPRRPTYGGSPERLLTSREEAMGFLEVWSGEDTDFPLVDELQWLGEAGFDPEVVWRKDHFAVLLCV